MGLPLFADWRQVDPMVYLTPFLTLIKASDVSGPITGAAAVALQSILRSELLGASMHAGAARKAEGGRAPALVCLEFPGLYSGDALRGPECLISLGASPRL